MLDITNNLKTHEDRDGVELSRHSAYHSAVLKPGSGWERTSEGAPGSIWCEECKDYFLPVPPPPLPVDEAFVDQLRRQLEKLDFAELLERVKTYDVPHVCIHCHRCQHAPEGATQMCTACAEINELPSRSQGPGWIAVECLDCGGLYCLECEVNNGVIGGAECTHAEGLF